MTLGMFKNTTQLRDRLSPLLECDSPDTAIIIPVNAQGDLQKVLDLLEDISQYQGEDRFHIILVVNNFDPEQPPTAELELYEQLGVQTVSVPELGGHAGIPPALRARMYGLPYAKVRACCFFDADCRIPDPTSCLKWYCESFRDAEVMLAYTKIGYYNWPRRLGMRAWLLVHYTWRAFKRRCLRIPTPQGASYGIDRDLKKELFDGGYLADETAIGRLVKAFGHKTVFAGETSRRVMADGRMYQNASAFRLFTGYAFRRLRINLNSMFVRRDAADRTGREEDKVHDYDAEGRVKADV